jgi:hypothetical protein
MYPGVSKIQKKIGWFCWRCPMSFEFVKAKPRRISSSTSVANLNDEIREETLSVSGSKTLVRKRSSSILLDTQNFMLRVGGRVVPGQESVEDESSIQEDSTQKGQDALVKLQGMWRKRKVQQLVNDRKREVISVHSAPQKNPHFMLHPNGMIRLLHQAVLCLVLIYLSIALPLDIAFSPGIPWQLEVATDVFFCVDLFMNFRSGYFDEDGTLIMDPWKVARNYACSASFVVDLVTTIPLNYVMSGLGNVRLLRIGKVAKISKLLRLNNLVREDMVELYEDFMASSSTIRLTVKLLNLAVFTGFLAHWLGCAWFAVGGKGEDSWATFYFMNQGTFSIDGIELDGLGRGPRFYLDKEYCSQVKVRDTGFDANCDLTTGKLYLASMYFAVVVMATVGFGDITPQSDNQRAFCFLAMLLGGAIYGYLIGNIASIVSDTDSETKKKNERMEQILGYMRRRRFPSDLERKVKK